jgi:hypothetical protein
MEDEAPYVRVLSEIAIVIPRNAADSDAARAIGAIKLLPQLI